MEGMQDLELEKLHCVERHLEELNAMYGTQNTQCIFCGSLRHNGEMGVVHTDQCAITIIRNRIRKKKHGKGVIT